MIANLIQNETGMIILRDCCIHPQENPPYLSKGAIESTNAYAVSIQPYGTVIAPYGTYYIPEVLYLPIRIVRVPDPDSEPENEPIVRERVDVV